MKINVTKLLNIPSRVSRKPNDETIALLHSTDGSHMVYDDGTSSIGPYSFELDSENEQSTEPDCEKIADK